MFPPKPKIADPNAWCDSCPNAQQTPGGALYQFPVPLPGAIEPVLVVVETQFEGWHRDRHYLFANPDQLAVGWFEEKPDVSLVGQVLLILRLRKILDENALASDWSVDGFGE